MKKRLLSLILALLIAASVCPFSALSVRADESPFDGPVTVPATNYDFIWLLWKIAGSPVVERENPFRDISEEEKPAAVWAYDIGLINGVSEDMFGRDYELILGNGLLWLWRYAGSPEPSITEVPFSYRSGFADKALFWAYESGTVYFDPEVTVETGTPLESVTYDPATGIFRMTKKHIPIRLDYVCYGDGINQEYLEGYDLRDDRVEDVQTIVVPEEGPVLNCPVTVIQDGALQGLTSLETLYLPRTLQRIGTNALPSSVTTIHYGGCSASQWNQIEKSGTDFSGVDIRYRAHCWDAGKPDESGNTLFTCTSCGETMLLTTVRADNGVIVSTSTEDAKTLKEVSLVSQTGTGETQAAANFVLKNAANAEQAQVYEIRLEEADGKQVQPNTAVTVTLPVPKGWDPWKLLVYHVDPETGTMEDMHAVVSSDGKTISFQTTHFSQYALVQSSQTEGWTAESPLPSNPFRDLKTDAFCYAPVIWAVNHDPQITNGTSPNTFSPDAACTRGQVVTFLWRAMGCPEPSNHANPFTDVSNGAYYYKAVLWANEKGITNGTSQTTFSPENPCTRAHVVTFLWRAHQMPAAGSSNPFVDVFAGQYYTNAVLWAVSKNITNGKDSSHFGPDDPCTRGQIVTFLYRDLKQ